MIYVSLLRAALRKTGAECMADYHGDLMYRTGTIYAAADDRNYFVAILLLLFTGALGGHRFYLNDMRMGWMYFLPFAIAVFVSFATLNFAVLLWEVGIVSVLLFCELIWFVYRWMSQ